MSHVSRVIFYAAPATRRVAASISSPGALFRTRTSAQGEDLRERDRASALRFCPRRNIHVASVSVCFLQSHASCHIIPPQILEQFLLDTGNGPYVPHILGVRWYPQSSCSLQAALHIYMYTYLLSVEILRTGVCAGVVVCQMTRCAQRCAVVCKG